MISDLRLLTEHQANASSYQLYIMDFDEASMTLRGGFKMLLCDECCRNGRLVLEESGGLPADLQLQTTQYGASDDDPTFYIRMPQSGERGYARTSDAEIA